MRTLAILITSMILFGCSSGPEPIRYGEEACDFCQMTIVDNRFGCELVTDKGKIYKFDAIECMANYQEAHSDVSWSHVMVTDFTKPGLLLDAENALILHSEGLPSPMGGYLSAVADTPSAERLKDQHGGEILRYSEVTLN
ncbi:MAG: nitrous oxide reductase accessory protein NosL [Bacteroidota bacterium]|nr:nitrous oxide reductase accessory protein NosL [Bacteroidota bacterium]MDX5428736.1 nitrous oxide reductase accessory protein NosL [Bacteroidota bacterium]MDX5447144.1 nitrous oxide reductase accessory protein NosL [Bacteroidota bacterium]MDX5506462.1 nitrous oxide reductase accessory protein NosL [Bacteroidota bacterium]